MKSVFITPGSHASFLTIAIALGLVLPSTHAASPTPPPPSGPPTAILTSLTIAGPETIIEGASGPYVCTATYSDGEVTPVSATWSEDSDFASVNSLGVLSAEEVGADENLVLTASFGGLTATKTITIEDVPVVLIGLTISGPASMSEESSAQFVCVARYSDGSTVLAGADWSENAGFASVNTSGLLSVGDITENRTVTLTATLNGFTDTHDVLVEYVPPVLTGISVFGPTTLDEETSESYMCIATYSDGATLAVSPSWSLNSGAASISSAGVLTAGNVLADQTVVLTASFGGQTDTHSVAITYVAPVLTSISIGGPSAVDEESSAQFSCVAHYSDGTSTWVTPTWSLSSAIASISGTGLLTSGNVTADGSVQMTASFGGATDTHTVVINYVAPTLSSIAILGPTTMDEESAVQFGCVATYSDGTTATVSPVWSLNSPAASISGTGLLTAGNVQEDQAVMMTATVDGISDSHSVSILYVAPVLTALSISGPSVVDEGSVVQYVCTASYSDGTSAVISPVWSVDSQFGLLSSTGSFQANDQLVDQETLLTATFGGEEATLPLTVRVAESQVIYPLSGYEGKTVRADLWDAVREELVYLGELNAPEELIIEKLNTNQWYWLTVKEFDDGTGRWVPVQENWINM